LLGPRCALYGRFVTASQPHERAVARDPRAFDLLVPSEWKGFVRQLLQDSRRYDFGPSWWGADGGFFAALETHGRGAKYRWDGMKRVQKDSPFFACQLTLAGWGAFEPCDAPPQKMLPGMAFCVSVPSRHRYYLPASSPGWCFCWLNLHHPYVLQRVEALGAPMGTILRLHAGSELVACLGRLVRGTFKKDFRDLLDVELAQFDFMLAYERVVRQPAGPETERESLLAAVRKYVLQHPGRSSSVEELAATYGLSRSHFSHFFRSRTGLTPARFMAETRIREATRLLIETRAPLKQISDACGFANVSHFAKVFRRFHQRTPAMYRRSRAG
jgi:AraC-like DNA-binding protein